MVERLVANEKVMGSNPITRSRKNMKVTTIQLHVTNNVDTNLKSIIKAIQSNANDTDWLVLPESATTNWCRPLHEKHVINTIEEQADLANINIAYGTPWQILS